MNVLFYLYLLLALYEFMCVFGAWCEWVPASVCVYVSVSDGMRAIAHTLFVIVAMANNGHSIIILIKPLACIAT